MQRRSDRLRPWLATRYGYRLGRKVTFYDRAIKGGVYDLQAHTPLFRLHGKTLGIAGFGKIGRTLYRKAKGFRLKIVVYDPYLADGSLDLYDLERVGFQDLLRRSDYISIHLPLSSETRHLFNREAFRQMKPTAFVINTSRGAIVDPEGLLASLEEGDIAGAALDVLPEEPPPPDDPLILHAKTIITPHAAFNSEESLLELQRAAATQMADVLSGKLPEFVVNPQVSDQPNLRAALRAEK